MPKTIEIATTDHLTTLLPLVRAFHAHEQILMSEPNRASVDEFYVRPKSRGRGLGAKALRMVRIEAKVLGIRALHLEVDRSNAKARKLYSGAKFEAREDYMLMTSLL